MFRITRGITIQPEPAFPNPALRFPDGTPIPIYAEEEDTATDRPPPQEDESAGKSAGALSD